MSRGLSVHSAISSFALPRHRPPVPLGPNYVIGPYSLAFAEMNPRAVERPPKSATGRQSLPGRPYGPLPGHRRIGPAMNPVDVRILASIRRAEQA